MPRGCEPHAVVRRVTNPLVGTMLALMVGAMACGPATDDGDAGADRDDSGATGDRLPTGTLRLGDDTYSFFFRERECDPEGTDPDYVTLSGFGTTPDDLRLRIQLERQPGDTPGEWLYQDVFVNIGGISDGESWEAKWRTGQDGAWYRGETGTEPVPGPLIEVDGRSISVDAPLQNDDGTERQAEIRAECPA